MDLEYPMVESPLMSSSVPCDTFRDDRLELRLKAAVLILAALSLSVVFDFPIRAQVSNHRIVLQEDGVYRVSFEQLETEFPWSLDAQWVSLEWQGSPVPVWVDDGGDGFFGPGDSIEFVAEHLSGDSSYYHPATRENVYWLNLDRPVAASMIEREMRLEGEELRSSPRMHHHLERDETRVRFSGRGLEVVPDEWYWGKMTPIDPRPLTLRLDLSRWDREVGPLALSLGFKGWSKPRRRTEGDPSDHRVEVWLEEDLLAAGEWSGEARYELQISDLDRSRILGRRPKLTLKVPRRKSNSGEAWVDVVLLDWVEVDYPVVPLPRSDRRILLDTEGGELLTIQNPTQETLLVYGSNGSRVLLTAPGGDQSTYETAKGESWVYAVSSRQHLKPSRVEADQPSSLRETDDQVDYLMITHGSLAEAIEPLAQFHRDRGLTVEIIDVQDIFDEFNGGIVQPEPLRDFIADAYQRRLAPAPRFVLLVGDASWDPRIDKSAEDRDYVDWTFRGDERHAFQKNASTNYAEESPHRNLIPARPYQSYEGHAAADNWYAAVVGDDFTPDLAIGRFPVTTPDEVAAIVDKTIRYVEEASVGPWRRQVLWITNEQRGMQRVSDHLAEGMRGRGYSDLKIYPQPEEKDNSQHQTRLKQAFGSGSLFVHFLGHGGRYIWRTGPPDFEKNHDLFTLDDLDALPATADLPIILSMTCYSAPFDHPTADSIGEKFLRLADRGAVAVLAASWRNNPGKQFSQLLFEELTQTTTVGEAIQRAKGAVSSRVLVETYNLLGDPAVPIGLPTEPIEVDWTSQKNQLLVTVDAGPLTGSAILELLDEAGTVVLEKELAVAGLPVELSLGLDEVGENAPRWLRVYAWDRVARRDGLVSVDLAPVAAEVSTKPQPNLRDERRERRRALTKEEQIETTGQVQDG